MAKNYVETIGNRPKQSRNKFNYVKQGGSGSRRSLSSALSENYYNKADIDQLFQQNIGSANAPTRGGLSELVYETTERMDDVEKITSAALNRLNSSVVSLDVSMNEMLEKIENIDIESLEGITELVNNVDVLNTSVTKISSELNNYVKYTNTNKDVSIAGHLVVGTYGVDSYKQITSMRGQNGASFYVNSDGTAAFFHKAYSSQSSAVNDAVLKFDATTFQIAQGGSRGVSATQFYDVITTKNISQYAQSSPIVTMTQAEYDALSVKDPQTIYLISDAESW